LEAWKHFRHSRDVELHFYGLPALPKRCFEGCGDNVVFHGSVVQQELFNGYQEGTVLVFPTLCDGFGAVITEALAHGLPVITTRNAGAADMVYEGRNGFLVPAGDASSLAERL